MKTLIIPLFLVLWATLSKLEKQCSSSVYVFFSSETQVFASWTLWMMESRWCPLNSPPASVVPWQQLVMCTAHRKITHSSWFTILRLVFTWKLTDFLYIFLILTFICVLDDLLVGVDWVETDDMMVTRSISGTIRAYHHLWPRTLQWSQDTPVVTGQSSGDNSISTRHTRYTRTNTPRDKLSTNIDSSLTARFYRVKLK